MVWINNINPKDKGWFININIIEIKIDKIIRKFMIQRIVYKNINFGD